MKPKLSIVIPVHNEQDNVGPLFKEIDAALDGNISFEIVVVDDCSTDATLEVLKASKGYHKSLRVLSHNVQCGQSSAIRTGILAATGELVATLDGDGQNDPADIGNLLQCFEAKSTEATPVLVAGCRQPRRDNMNKRTASVLANGIRRRLLRDKAIDSGCGLKLFSRECFLRLPYFDNMHRYLPALMLREGFDVEFVDVTHRPRIYGKSNYGIMDRLLVSIGDMLGLMWLKRRCSLPDRPLEH